MLTDTLRNNIDIHFQMQLQKTYHKFFRIALSCCEYMSSTQKK